MPIVDENVTEIDYQSTDSELVIGLVGAVGTKLNSIVDELRKVLKHFDYKTNHVKVSTDIIRDLPHDKIIDESSEFKRIDCYMDAGDRLRKMTKCNDILAHAIALYINSKRKTESSAESDVIISKPMDRTAHIIDSLKHPDEVHRLRKIYNEGFYLIGVHSDKNDRIRNLVEMGMSEHEAEKLNKRDKDEGCEYGQKTSKTFHLADFFVLVKYNQFELQNDIKRFLSILFGNPYITPTFDEYSMFLAFAAALRSGDLSRQVGSVIAKDKEIVGTGANDVPRFGGGLYWSHKEYGMIIDDPRGRDFTIGYDSNQKEKAKIAENIIDKIKEDNLLKKLGFTEEIQTELFNLLTERSRLNDLTEFGRAVHAEMEAIISCARKGISLRGATIYCTTFPCHNCAKHIVCAGLKRVVFIEPYPKSKALLLHPDSITDKSNEFDKKVVFEPFIGVGPRRFFDLFSMSLSSGHKPAIRKENGKTIDWDNNPKNLRVQLLKQSYLDREDRSIDFLKHLFGESNGS